MSIQFYSDSSCTIAIGEDSGTIDGNCTLFSTTEFASFKVISLEQTCAVTVYNSDTAFCSSSKLSIANLGECYTDTSVNQFSVDCQSVAIASTAAVSTVAGVPGTSSSAGPSSATDSQQTNSAAGSPSASDAGSTGTNAEATVTIVSTASPSSATSASSTGTSTISSSSGLSLGAKMGIAVGAVLGAVLLVLAIAFFVNRNNRRRSAGTPSPAAGEKLEGDAHLVSVSNNQKGAHAGLPPGYELSSEERKVAELPLSERRVLVEAPSDGRWTGPHELDASTTSDTK